MAFSPNAETVYADGPFTAPRQPSKAEIRALLKQYEAVIDAFTSNGGLIYTSKAQMDADLLHGAKSSAWVIGDATVANNGIYQKQGASGAGSWTRVGNLPYSFIIATDAGAGTANAIQATTSIPVNTSALVWMNIFEANTASVTVSFNGGSALTIKTNSGNNVAAGGLVAGMIVLGIVSGSTFRLLSDQVSAAIVAAAEAAQVAAQAAQAAAEAAAASAVALVGLAATAVQPNGSSGITRTSTAAGEAIDPGLFGGKFLSGKGASKFRIETAGPTDSSDGPRFVHSIEHVFPGGTDNTPVGDDDGPDDVRGGAWFYSSIANWKTTTNYGEANLIYGLGQGGIHSDLGGLLLGLYKVFDDTSSEPNGSVTPIELTGNRCAPTTGAVTGTIRSIVGLQNPTNSYYEGGIGFATYSEMGNNIGFAAFNRPENSPPTDFNWAYTAWLAQTPGTMYYGVRWDGDATLRLGLDADHALFRYSTADHALYLKDEGGTTNNYVFAKDGIFRARAGVTVADNQAPIKRVLTNTASLNVASTAAFTSSATLTMTVTGALVGDTVIVNVVSGTLAGAQFNYLAEVTATNTVTIYPFNMSGSTADPSAQTFRATVFGF